MSHKSKCVPLSYSGCSFTYHRMESNNDPFSCKDDVEERNTKKDTDSSTKVAEKARKRANLILVSEWRLKVLMWNLLE